MLRDLFDIYALVFNILERMVWMRLYYLLIHFLWHCLAVIHNFIRQLICFDLYLVRFLRLKSLPRFRWLIVIYDSWFNKFVTKSYSFWRDVRYIFFGAIIFKLLKPFRFFGSPLKMSWRAVRRNLRNWRSQLYDRFTYIRVNFLLHIELML